ncbi:MAG: N-formylglutamate amidohydrolase [Alphaproteobacteria bacterium]
MDGAPITVANPGGTSPILLMCDHASNALPEDYWRLGLPEHVFDEHIAYDIGARDVTLRLSDRLDATAVLTNFSRLLIDPNREPDHEGLVPTYSDGIEIPGNRDLDGAEIERRLHLFHQPFHDALAQQIIAMGARGIVPASIGIHSFTPIMQGAGRPWQVGILWNRDPRIPEPLIDWLRRDPQLTVGDNQPYSGRLLGHTMNEHGGKHGLANAVIEIRQDLIDTPDKAHAWADRIADALTAISSDASIFTIRHY